MPSVTIFATFSRNVTILSAGIRIWIQKFLFGMIPAIVSLQITIRKEKYLWEENYPEETRACFHIAAAITCLEVTDTERKSRSPVSA